MMQAGKELDALVAEKVMGLVWDETRCRICGWPLRENIDRGCILTSCSQRPAPPSRADAPAPYSTDIAAAWQVVDQMRGEYMLALTDHITSWSASFVKLHGLGSKPIEAPTAPLAICLAALKAVGVEV